MFHPGLQDLIQKQKRHAFYADPAQISQIITPLAKTWLYWKKIYLYWPEDAESPIEHCWSDGFQPILFFGLTEKTLGRLWLLHLGALARFGSSLAILSKIYGASD
jgi:hypothetical protein